MEEDIERQSHEDHLNLLAIFYYVSAGLSALGIFFLVGHYMMMNMVFTQVEIEQKAEAERLQEATEAGEVASVPVEAMPDFIQPMLLTIYLVLGGVILLYAVCLVFAGIFIKKRTHRMYTMVMAGISCMNVPLGTALGVFTFIKLSNHKVIQLYHEEDE